MIVVLMSNNEPPMFVVFTKLCEHKHTKVWNTPKLTDTHRYRQTCTNVLNFRFHLITDINLTTLHS